MVRTAVVLAVVSVLGAARVAIADPLDPTAPARRVVVTESSVEVLGPIRFAGTSAAITPESAPMLDAIAHTLDGNPEIRVIEVRAFGAGTTTRGARTLADRRARAIAIELVRRGVAATRLRPHGIARPPSGATGDPEIRILVLGS